MIAFLTEPYFLTLMDRAVTVDADTRIRVVEDPLDEE